MRKLSLQFENSAGAILREKDIEVSEGDKLIIRADHDLTNEETELIFDSLYEALTDVNHTGPIFIPPWIELGVLRIK